MSIVLIPAGNNILESILPEIEGADRDYSRNLVVFPGRRPSHFLRKAMAGQIQGSFIPPVIYSMDEFVDYVCNKTGPRRKLESIDAAAILYQIHLTEKDRLGGDSFMTPDRFFPIGLKIYSDIEELCIEGVSSAKVREIQPYAEEAIPPLTLKRLQSLSFFYDEFYRRIEKERLSTRAVRYRQAAENIGDLAHDFRKIIFAGFFALTSAEKTIFRKLSGLGNTLFIFQEGPGIKDRLTELGIDVDETKGEGGDPGIHFYRSPDTHGQVYALSSILESITSTGKKIDERTAVVLSSSETLFPLLRQGLSSFDEGDYNVSIGYPLQRTPVFGFLNHLMELVSSMEEDRLYLPDYLKFMLHPYTKNILFKGSAEVTRIIYHALEEGLTAARTRTFLTLAEIEEDPELLNFVMARMPQENPEIRPAEVKEHLKNIHSNTLGRFISFVNVGDFASKCGAVLTYIFNNSTAKLHPLFFPFSESFMRAIDTIERSLMKETAFTEVSSYFSFFRKFIMTCHTPFEGTPVKGLQVLGFLETRNIKFDRVLVLDANEEVIPDARKEDTLLPFKARKILGLSTYLDREKLMAYYFSTVIAGAGEAHLFFIENATKERSRFVERLLWAKQKKDGTAEEKNYLKSVRYKVRLRNSDPEEIFKTDEIIGYLKGFTYSASALDRYFKCPLDFYYSYVLGIDKKQIISEDIERIEVGKFVHNVLSAYFSKMKGRPLRTDDLDIAGMRLLVDKLFEREYGKNPSGAIYLLKKQVDRHLSDLLTDYYDPLTRKNSITILDTEEPVNVTMESFHLKGRLDSVEKRGEKICIVDFKTGSNRGALGIRFDKLDPEDRGTWKGAIGSLQLPFYIMIYSAQTGISPEEMEGIFLLLGTSDISEKIELPLFGDSDPARGFSAMKTVISELLKEIVNKDVPFRPSADRKRVCPDCSFRYLCGTQWIP